MRSDSTDGRLAPRQAGNVRAAPRPAWLHDPSPSRPYRRGEPRTPWTVRRSSDTMPETGVTVVAPGGTQHPSPPAVPGVHAPHERAR